MPLEAILASSILALHARTQTQTAPATATPAQAVALAQPSAPAGRPAPVWQGSQANRLSRIIDKVTVNPILDDSLFSRPETQTAALKGK